MGIRHPHRPSEYPNLLLYVLDEVSLGPDLRMLSVASMPETDAFRRM